MIAKLLNLAISSSLSAAPIYYTNNYINNLSYQNKFQVDDPIKVMKNRLYELSNNLDTKLNGLYNLKRNLNKTTFKGLITEQESKLFYSNRKYLPSSFNSDPSYKKNEYLDKHSKTVYKSSIKYIPQTLLDVHILTHYVYTTWAGNSWETIKNWLRASKTDGHIDKNYGNVTINPVHSEINPLHNMCLNSDLILSVLI